MKDKKINLRQLTFFRFHSERLANLSNTVIERAEIYFNINPTSHSLPQPSAECVYRMGEGVSWVRYVALTENIDNKVV